LSDDLPPAMRAPRVTTTVTLKREVWLWLREQAADVALRDGGKPNAGSVIERLVSPLIRK
jgi:hypothetical protein